MIIGISGKIGSGKDTLANFIILHNKVFKKKSFAYNLKYVTQFLTNTNYEDNHSQEGKNKYLPEWGLTIGEFQQKLGTEGLRNGVHENGWVISLFSTYHKKENWIITDVRFPNEADAVKERNGILIRITGDPANIRKNSKRDLNHASETSLDSYADWDYEYINNKIIYDLEDFAKIILENL